MINQIFNTTFETSLRVMLILFSSQKELSLTQLTVFDFAAIYGSDFSISDCNLHGNNNFRFSEYTVKREQIKKAIKELVLDGYVIPQFTSNGFTYYLSEHGVNFCKKLNDEYADKYMNYINKVVIHFSKHSERELTQLIYQRAITALGGQ